MAMYDVTFELLADTTASAVMIGLVPAQNTEEAEHKARAYLQAQKAYKLGSMLEIAEQPHPGDFAWGHVNLIPRGTPPRNSFYP